MSECVGHGGHAQLVAHDVLAEEPRHPLVVRLRRVRPALPRAALATLQALRRRLARTQPLEARERVGFPARRAVRRGGQSAAAAVGTLRPRALARARRERVGLRAEPRCVGALQPPLHLGLSGQVST